MRDRVWRRAIIFGFLAVISLSLSEACKAQVTVSASQLDFGSVYVGNSAKQSVTITNTGTIPLVMFSPYLTATGDFSYQSDCPFSTAATPDMFAAGAVCSINVQFFPSRAGVESAILSFPVYSQLPDASTLPLQTVTINLTGTGLMPVTISPSLLDFGFLLEQQYYKPPTLPLTIANKGGMTLYLVPGAYQFFTNPTGVIIQNQDCSVPYGNIGSGFVLPPAGSCTAMVSVATNVTGPQALPVGFSVFRDAYHSQVLGQVTGTAKFTGHPLFVGYPPNFGLVLVGTSANAAVTLVNYGSAPVNVYNATVSGAPFSLLGSCIGSLAPGAACSVWVTYTPTQAVADTGTLTVTSDDVTSPQGIALTGTGTAVKLTLQGSAASGSNLFDFGIENMDIPSTPSQLILTNTGPRNLALKGITSNGDDYSQKNKCKSSLAPGASCTIDITFDPEADGLREGKLTVAEEDPASPRTVDLSGYGVGIGHQTVYVHYDYMVATDHTDDPEVVAPGAIQRVVNTFASHGVELVIDPHHNAIPAVPVLDFQGFCPDYPEFSDLVAKYFKPKFPDQHYVLFADSYTTVDFLCQPSGSSGISELPGQHFLVTLRRAELQGFPEYDLSLFYSGAFMHELGHNFGLHHGGGIGPYGDERNYKPNFVSNMNYYFDLNGILQADAAGSLSPRQCSADPDCPNGGSCIGDSSTGGVCVRVDYSDQLLPTGGNTPGALDERNLNEPAGLGSGSTDLTIFNPGCDSYALDLAASDGPVDWDDDGDSTETSLAVDLTYIWTQSCFTSILPGWNDWASLLGPTENNVNEPNDNQASDTAGASTKQQSIPEMDFETAKRTHVLLPVRPAPVVIEPSCRAPGKPVLPYRAGILTVALLATGDFDPHQVDLSSLYFHHAKPVNTWFEDVNNDGMPDLVMQFRGSEVRLSKQATKAHLTGWLKNSQAFVGERDIIMASNPSAIIPACQQ
jgi:hypothetical protein